MKYLIFVGEASGDLHASRLIQALRDQDPKAEFRFFGGDQMARAARCNPELHYKDLNVMGFSAVVRKFPKILKALKLAKKIVSSWRPDAIVLVDFPSFNMKIAAFAKKLGIPVFYFISPKVWAWKEWRVKQMKRDITEIFSILPFEIPFFKKHGMDNVTYVGNPSVKEMEEVLAHIPPLRHFLERQGIEDDGRPLIALLPGSREAEIAANLPLMIAAAKKYPDFRYVVAAAPAIPEKYYREVAQDPGLHVVFGATQVLLKYSRAALVTSGTATLETALLGCPQVVCYRNNGSRLTFELMKRLVKVRDVSLPNLIAGHAVVPELLFHMCSTETIAHELSPLLQASPRRDWQLAGYKQIRNKLGTSDAAQYAAELIMNRLQKKVK